MKRHLIAAFAAAAVASPLLAWATTAHADDANGYNDQPTPVTPVTPIVPVVPARAESTYGGPNRALLSTGLISFTGAYVPAVIVGAESTSQVDHRLYIPVAGPWINLAERPGCGDRGTNCDRETTNKVLVIASGVFQGAGVLTALSAFLFPEKSQTVAVVGQNQPKPADAKKVSVHVAPTELGSNGYGLTAFGGF
jgi:hypothetical protein